MQRTINPIRRLAPMVVLAVFVLAAFGEGAAGAAGVGDGKAAAQADAFVPGITDFPSRLGEVGERAAEARLAETSLQGPLVTVQESGFDWSAGATGAIAATLLLFGAALALRTAKRSRVALG
jgi:hypothetical protein